MIFDSKRLRERKDGLSLFDEMTKDKSRSKIIHYSCESFVIEGGRSPRITSICIRNLHNAQTKSFSIHLQAQIEGRALTSDSDYDLVERKMLDEYFIYVSSSRDCKWIHWNMRDSNYGFEAINNRYRILGGAPTEIPEDKKFDLPRILVKIYGKSYEKNGTKGRLLHLAERNHISTKDALTGKEEADAFANRTFLNLHVSTLRKVDILDSIIQAVDGRDLKTNSRLVEVYGVSPSGLREIINNNLALQLLVAIVLMIVGAVIENPVQNLFGFGG